MRVTLPFVSMPLDLIHVSVVSRCLLPWAYFVMWEGQVGWICE
jgi:hypothetical protein